MKKGAPALFRTPGGRNAERFLSFMIESENTTNATQMPEASNEELRKRQRATLDEHRPGAWAKSIAARKGKALSQEHTAKLSASHKKRFAERPVKRKVPRRMIAEDTLLGLSSIASAKKREALYGKPGGLQADVSRMRKATGFPPGWPAAYRHGDALGWKHFGDFCSDFGHTKKEWAPLIQASYRGYANRVKAKGDRPFSSPRPGAPHPGKLLNAKWAEFIERYCYTQGRRWRMRDFLTSEIRDIPIKHAALREAFGILGEALQAEGGRIAPEVRIARDVDSVSEWICWKAIYDQELQVLVRFLLPLRDLLREKPKLLEAGAFKSEVLASELLARDYKATPSRIDDVIAGKLQALHPSSLCKLTSTQSGPAAEVVAQTKRAKKSVSARTVEKGQLCDQVEREMRKIKALCTSGGRTIVEIQLAYPDFVVWKIRDALTQEDREHFNRPRQWGPVIGYAEIILGKHYDGKSAQTVRGWVKDYRTTSRKPAA